jgi:hypothetical protein
LAGDFTGVSSVAATGATAIEGDAAGLGAGGGTTQTFTISADKQFAYAVNSAALVPQGKRIKKIKQSMTYKSLKVKFV